jgi:hypothetical protein
MNSLKAYFFFPFQNSIKFVKQAALEDETELKGIPPEDCSKIMLWRLNLPVSKSPSYHLSTTGSTDASRRKI